MARQQPILFESAYEAFLRTPAWVGPALASALFLAGRFILPLTFPKPEPGQLDPGVIFRPVICGAAYIIAGIIFLAWLGAEINKLCQRRLLDRQTGLDSIRSLHWAEFEQLVGEAFRRQGYTVDHTGSTASDGGVDLVLRRPGEVTLVQCKQWRAFRVGVRPVRELLGVVTARRADRGITITSGRFTAEAEQFAGGNPLELIDGFLLAKMIASVRQGAGPKRGAPTAAPVQLEATSPVTHVPVCPLCGKPMVSRTAKKGVNAGSKFWGCPTYPACRGTRQMA